jgi:high-affinity iron transporter
MAEASLLPNSDALHQLTEPYGPDGKYGRFITYSLILLPAAWLIFSSMFAEKPAVQKQTTRKIL